MLHNKHKVTLIAAVDLEGGFAKEGKIPWHYKEDFKWFKNKTTGHICVMGRTTYEDINERIKEKQATSEVKEGTLEISTTTLLPNRECFVVSSTLTSLDNAKVIKKWWDVDRQIPFDDPRTIFVIGGERLFSEAIAVADEVILTVVNDTFGCDRFFPIKYLTEHFTDTKLFKVETEPNLRFVIWQRIAGK